MKIQNFTIKYTDCMTINSNNNFQELLEFMVLRSVYFMVKFRFFIPELWDFIHQIVGYLSYVVL
jgi:hypothetical protein